MKSDEARLKILFTGKLDLRLIYPPNGLNKLNELWTTNV